MTFQIYSAIVVIYVACYLSANAVSCFKNRNKISQRTKFEGEL